LPLWFSTAKSRSSHGFLKEGSTYITFDVPGATYTAASGINDTGQIVGTYLNASGNHGFLKEGSTYTTIDVPGATDTGASGINDTGQIVGGSNAGGFLKEGSTYTTLAVPGATATVASGINDTGQIVGTYFPASTGFLATPVVPEPASVVMGATAVLVGLGYWWRRRTLLVALLAVLALLAGTWKVLDREEREFEYARTHAVRGSRPVRYLGGYRLPDWWPLPWPEATAMESWCSSPGWPPLPPHGPRPMIVPILGHGYRPLEPRAKFIKTYDTYRTEPLQYLYGYGPLPQWWPFDWPPVTGVRNIPLQPIPRRPRWEIGDSGPIIGIH
jgi:hypothetical protein